MERYFSEALYRSGRFVACLLLIILTSCALLFWQDSKLVNLVNGSMANLTDNMQSMAIKTEDLTLLIQKIEKLEQKNGELEMKIENLVNQVKQEKVARSDSEKIVETSTALQTESEPVETSTTLQTESEPVTQAVYDNNGCKSNQYYRGWVISNICDDDSKLSEYESVKNGQSDLAHLNIKSVGSNLFAEQTQLLYINIFGNGIEHLPPNLVDKNLDLKIFNAGSNKLLAIPRGFFRQNTKLEEIYFRNNQLKSIEPNLLNGQVDLKEFSADSNKLLAIPQRFFQHNIKLEYISFINNQLKEIDAKILGINAATGESTIYSNN